jgi:hypothetical protein
MRTSVSDGISGDVIRDGNGRGGGDNCGIGKRGGDSGGSD